MVGTATVISDKAGPIGILATILSPGEGIRNVSLMAPRREARTQEVIQKTFENSEISEIISDISENLKGREAVCIRFVTVVSFRRKPQQRSYVAATVEIQIASHQYEEFERRV
jgi:hypothetical protein